MIYDDTVSFELVDDLLVLIEDRRHRVVEHLTLSETLLDVRLVGANGHQPLSSLNLEVHQVFKLCVELGLLLDQGEDEEVRDLTSCSRHLHNEVESEYII